MRRAAVWAGAAALIWWRAAACQAEKRPFQPRVSPMFVAPLWEMEAWPRLLLRNGAAGTLLLTVVNADGTRHGVVYQYDPQWFQLKDIASEAWDQSLELIADCSAQLTPPAWQTTFRVDPDGRLLYDNARMSPAGRVALSLTFAPNPTQVAVLSAKGPKVRRVRGVLSFPLGGGNAMGPHYHEILNLDAFAFERDSFLELPFRTDHIAFRACWSADERFIVYASIDHRDLCVIERK